MGSLSVLSDYWWLGFVRGPLVPRRAHARTGFPVERTQNNCCLLCVVVPPWVDVIIIIIIPLAIYYGGP